MAKYVYPAIFLPEKEGGYSVSFPDLDGCPEWLNEEATAIGVNFSQVLQEALMNKVNAGK